MAKSVRYKLALVPLVEKLVREIQTVWLQRLGKLPPKGLADIILLLACEETREEMREELERYIKLGERAKPDMCINTTTRLVTYREDNPYPSPAFESYAGIVLPGFETRYILYPTHLTPHPDPTRLSPSGELPKYTEADIEEFFYLLRQVSTRIRALITGTDKRIRPTNWMHPSEAQGDSSKSSRRDHLPHLSGHHIQHTCRTLLPYVFPGPSSPEQVKKNNKGIFGCDKCSAESYVLGSVYATYKPVEGPVTTRTGNVRSAEQAFAGLIRELKASRPRKECILRLLCMGAKWEDIVKCEDTMLKDLDVEDEVLREVNELPLPQWSESFALAPYSPELHPLLRNVPERFMVGLPFAKLSDVETKGSDVETKPII